MAVIAMTSAKGAPGVTTSALAIALMWPRPCLLLEADVAGSSSILAGYLRGSVRHDRGLVDLALAHRRGTLVQGLHEASIPLPNTSVRLLAGLKSPAQVQTVKDVWEPLAAALSGMDRAGTDVIIDAGRIGAEGAPTPLLREADLTLLTTRTSLPAIAAARARCEVLREDLTHRGAGEDALHLLLVGEGQPYSRAEIAAAVHLPVAATISWDPVNAEVLSRGAEPSRRFQSSTLIRSSRAAVSAVQKLLIDRRERLAPGTLVTTHEGVNHG